MNDATDTHGQTYTVLAGQAHQLCGAPHPTEPIRCELVRNPGPHPQHVGSRTGEGTVEERTVVWANAAAPTAFQAVVASPPGGCSERTWCTLGLVELHLERHESDPFPLAGYREEAHETEHLEADWRGWRGYLQEGRDASDEVELTLEGAVEHNGALEHFTSTLDATTAWDLLEATVDKAVHLALLERLKGAVGES